MKKIITALQNENVNKKLAEDKNIKMMTNDIQYQEGIIEALEIDSNIDFIIFSELLPGEMKIEKLIEKIRQKNKNIKLIIILENKKEELENYLLSKGKIFIFYNNEITIEELLKVIEEKSNQEMIEQEILEIKKIIKKENNFLEEEKEDENKNYFLAKKEKEEIEREVEENFETNKIINWINNLFHKKDKKKSKKIILITGLKGSRKNIFHN